MKDTPRTSVPGVRSESIESANLDLRSAFAGDRVAIASLRSTTSQKKVDPQPRPLRTLLHEAL